MSLEKVKRFNSVSDMLNPWEFTADWGRCSVQCQGFLDQWQLKWNLRNRGMGGWEEWMNLRTLLEWSGTLWDYFSLTCWMSSGPARSVLVPTMQAPPVCGEFCTALSWLEPPWQSPVCRHPAYTVKMSSWYSLVSPLNTGLPFQRSDRLVL